MPITLKITSYHRLTPGQQESFQTELQRFSIGRGENNQWTIPDPQLLMSRTHCWFENRNGNWTITDTSSHGVFINGSDQRMERNGSATIHHGDQIRIGDYELEILLDESASAEPKEETLVGNYDDPFSNGDEEFSPNPPAPAQMQGENLKEVNTPLSQMDQGLIGDSVSIDQLYGLEDPEAEPEPPPSLTSQGDQASALNQHFDAPRVAPAPTSDLPDKYAADISQIPDNWDEESGIYRAPESLESPAPEPPPQTTPPAAAPQQNVAPQTAPATTPAQKIRGGESAMAAFAAGADIDPGQLQVENETEFFENLGEILKIMTEGLMQAVKTRTQVKSEFRLDQTMIAPTQNNPLKFSVSVQEALTRMLSQTDQAYLSGTEAASEAIDDVNTHQLAVLAGTEAALKSILLRFKPSTLEAKFEQNTGGGKSPRMFKRAKYWDYYKILYTEAAEAAEDDFQQFFGTEFSSAYQSQLDRLKSSRK